MNQRRIRSLALLALIASPACSDDDGGQQRPDDNGGRDAAAASDSGARPPNEPRYVVATRIWDTSGDATSYFHVVPSLAAGTELDPADALEVLGSAKLYAHDDAWFAVGSSEDPTITRYTLDDAGRLVAGDSISLQPYGVTDLWDTLYFVSPTKAYYPDRAGTQLIVWNPRTMEVDSSIPLEDTVRDGQLALYGYTPIMRGDTLLFSVGWFDWEVDDSVLPETGLVALDTTTDTVLRVDVDERCGGITQTVVTDSGDAYFVSSAMAAAAYELERLDSEPCALRVRAGEDTFDADYLQSLGELSGGALAGEPMPAGGDDVFLRVFDGALGEVAEGAMTWELTGQAAWRWLRWNTATGAVETLDTLEPSTADVLWFVVDGRVFGTETTPEYEETTLIDFSAEGGPERALTAPGFLHGLARIQ